mgnify:CR=1 FL=1
MDRYRLLARRSSTQKQKPDQLALIGSESLAALAEFLTRPQADPQIGATTTVRRIPPLSTPSAEHRPCAAADEPASQSLSLSSSIATRSRILAAAHAIDQRPRCGGVAAEHALLDLEQMRRMHGEVAQAHAQKHPRQPELARHFAADGDRTLPALLAVAMAMRDQLQHRWMQGIVQVRHRVVGAIDGKRVLNQVVGADRQEVEPLRERADGEHRRRYLDHPANLDAGIERHALLAQAVLGARDHDQGLIDLARRKRASAPGC